jgi:uracil-DNA glycosylase
MFIFLESIHHLGLQIPNGFAIGKGLHFSEAKSFIEMIKVLSDNANTDPKQIVILYDFFSVGCKDLSLAQKRGLERIAITSIAIEIRYQERITRFCKSCFIGELYKTIKETQFDKASMVGIGQFTKGNILIVGESPGPNNQDTNTPFVGSGSGLWLLKKLEEESIDETKLFWVNAIGADCDILNKDFVKTLQPSKIIALGTIAKQWAREFETEIEVINILHPQYWRRFRSSEEYPLASLIK